MCTKWLHNEEFCRSNRKVVVFPTTIYLCNVMHTIVIFIRRGVSLVVREENITRRVKFVAELLNVIWIYFTCMLVENSTFPSNCFLSRLRFAIRLLFTPFPVSMKWTVLSPLIRWSITYLGSTTLHKMTNCGI